MYKVYDSYDGLSVGDVVSKVKGRTKFIGNLLAIYNEPENDTIWAVVRCHESEYTGHLQHLYPLHMFAKYE